ncbi:MAG: hypothetical protein GPOALKHO_001719 [Sodalis sp.]|nr:MAG: hypothetical protein GPOALKHO_001719 [Sodalis sp.]
MPLCHNYQLVNKEWEREILERFEACFMGKWGSGGA